MIKYTLLEIEEIYLKITKSLLGHFLIKWNKQTKILIYFRPLHNNFKWFK